MDFKPTVVGISLRNIDNVDYENFIYYYEDLPKTLKLIKGIDCNLSIIIGGSGFSIFPKQIMEANAEINYGVFLEGEETIVELLNNLDNPKQVKGVYYRKQNQINFTGQRKPIDFKRVPIPERKFFQMDKYNNPLCVGIQSKRGCVLTCSYCTYIHLNGARIRLRSVTSVVDEIEIMKNKYNISEIIFTDNVFNIPKSHSIGIMNELLNREIKIKWSAWFDIKTISQEFIDIARQSGCYRMCFSPDGVVNESLNALMKNINENDIKRLIILCKKNSDIDFRFSLFALPPKQTIRGLFKTIAFVFKTHLLIKNSKCLISWIRLHPNTELFNQINYQNNLLPKSVIHSNKYKLFLTDSIYPKFIIIIYRQILNIINYLRILRKIHRAVKKYGR